MVVIIVQARMGSTRLPGKVLSPILGRPMLAYQLERLRRVRRAREIVVATTTGVADDAIVEFCAAEAVRCVRGSEGDVLSRYVDAARVVGATVVVRVTSDCPLIEPEMVDRAIDLFLGESNPDFVSNMIEPTWPLGMAVEVVSAATLAVANLESNDKAEREHVTPFIYWRPQRYRLLSMTMTPNLSHHRWTVDTAEDMELVTKIFEDLYVRKRDFGMADVLGLLEERPELKRINAHVEQKVAARVRGA